MTGELLACWKCGHVCSENQIEPLQIFSGSETEPPEYLDVCPECGAHDSMDEVPI